MKLTNRQRRDRGMAYIADESVTNEQYIGLRLSQKYSRLKPYDRKGAERLLRKMGVTFGENVYFVPPLTCEYGTHLKIGSNLFANANCTILDIAQVTIGDNCMFGPNVTLCTAGHPVHPGSRNTGWEYGKPIVIGSNTWIGTGAIILPGVTVGNGCVIGGGSVVTRDIPDMTVAVGNPCRVIRRLTDEDRKYLFRDECFDEAALADILSKCDPDRPL